LIIDSLFENNINTIRTKISESIHTATQYWLPYILIDNLRVTIPTKEDLNGIDNPNDLDNIIRILIEFSVGQEGIGRSITLGLNNTGDARIISE